MVNLFVLFCLLLASELSAQENNETSLSIEDEYYVGELAMLQGENRQLENDKKKLITECQKNIDYWTAKYNETYSKLAHDMPQVVELEKKLSYAVAKEAGLDTALEELRIHLELFTLKKSTLQTTIEFLIKYEAYAPTCFNYGKYIGFQRKVKLEKFRTRGRPRKSRTFAMKATNGTILQDRESILMNVMIQEERFKNNELKMFMAYHSGYCNRKVEHLKQLIESLSKWPEAGVLHNQIESEIQRVNASITAKSKELLGDRNKLQGIIAELMSVQEEYNSREDESDCFTKLNKWSVKDALIKLQDTLHDVINFQPKKIEDSSHLALEVLIDKYRNKKPTQ